METYQDKMNAFFSRETSGTLFLAVDPNNNYQPFPTNMVCMVEKYTPQGFENFIRDVVRDTAFCTYIPDAQLLRMDFVRMCDVPKPGKTQPFSSYIADTLSEYIAKTHILPTQRLSLRDAAFALKYNRPLQEIIDKGVPESDEFYCAFMSDQQDRERRYFCDPEFHTPLIVAQTDKGYLLFSDNHLGKQGLKEYAQRITDNYFSPHLDIHSLALYECEGLTPAIAPFIDKSYTTGTLCNKHTFTPHSYTLRESLPKDFNENLNLIIRSEFKPTSGNFMYFADFLHRWPTTQTQISPKNEDIYRLLTIKESGYINIHSKVFNYSESFRSLAEKLEQTTQVKDPKKLDLDTLETLTKETVKRADEILKSEFDVRGHRSVIHMLEDPAERVFFNSKMFFADEKEVLARGDILFVPTNSETGNKEFFAQYIADKDTILITPHPVAPGKVYTTINRKIEPYNPPPAKDTAKSKHKTPKL